MYVFANPLQAMTILATEQQATALALSPDSKFLAVGMANGVAVWSLATEKQSAFLPSSIGVHSLAFAEIHIGVDIPAAAAS